MICILPTPCSYDMMRYDITYMIRYMIYLTETGMTTGNSNKINIYTQTIYRTTQSTQIIHTTTIHWLRRVRTVPGLCEVCPGICRTTEEKARKTLSQGSRKMSVGKKYTEMCFVWSYTQIAIVSLYNTNQFVSVMEYFGLQGLVLLPQLVC
jgi:hypothetical protein